VAFFASLTRNGYFGGEMQGSKEWRRLHDLATAQYENASWSEKARVACVSPATRAKEALSTEALSEVSTSDTSDTTYVVDTERIFDAADSDSWMSSYSGAPDDPLEIALSRREGEQTRRATQSSSPSKRKGKEPGERDDHENDPLAEMSRRLAQFMGEKSGVEGVEDVLLRTSATKDAKEDANQSESENENETQNDADDAGASLLDARAFLKELNGALGILGDGVGGGKPGDKKKEARVVLEGTYTDSDDDFSDSSDDSDSDDSDSDDESPDSRADDARPKPPAGAETMRTGTDKKEGHYVYENASGGDWGGAAFSLEYERAMRRQLEGTKVASSFGKQKAGEQGERATTGESDENKNKNKTARSKILPRGFEGRRPRAFQSDQKTAAGADGESEDVSSSDDSDSGLGSDDGDALNVNLNLVQNMLASFRGQAGAAGPASQLLASMGVDQVGFGNLHSDDDEDAEEDGNATRC
tara:strand:+ start:6019 stop:7437 length:1419 start_codon:yes stop_codon:yes gene_type:complete